MAGYPQARKEQTQEKKNRFLETAVGSGTGIPSWPPGNRGDWRFLRPAGSSLLDDIKWRSVWEANGNLEWRHWEVQEVSRSIKSGNAQLSRQGPMVDWDKDNCSTASFSLSVSRRL